MQKVFYSPWLAAVVFIITTGSSSIAAYAQKAPGRQVRKQYYYRSTAKEWNYERTEVLIYDNEGNKTAYHALKEENGKTDSLQKILYRYWNDDIGNSYIRAHVYNIRGGDGAFAQTIDTTGTAPDGSIIKQASWRYSQGKWERGSALYHVFHKDAQGHVVAAYMYNNYGQGAAGKSKPLELHKVDSFLYQDGRLAGIKHFTVRYGSWSYSEGEEYGYDARGNVISIVQYLFFLGKPSGTTVKDSITWHSFEKKQMKGYRFWMVTDGQWQCQYRCSITYDDKGGYVSLKEKYNEESRKWLPYQKEEYLSEENGSFTARNTYEWKAGQWEVKYYNIKYDKVYEAGKLKEVTSTRIYPHKPPVPYFRFVYQ